MNPWIRSADSIVRALDDLERQDLKNRLGAKTADPEDLCIALLDPERIATVIRRLSQDGLHALRTWVLESGLWRHIPRQSRLAAGVIELQSHGWVFETQYGPYQRYLIMPRELLPRVLPLLFEIPWDRITVPSAPRITGPAPIWTPFWHDLFQMLSFARQEPLLLTTQGDVYRRQKTKLEKLLWPRPVPAIQAAMVDYLLMLMNRQGLVDTLDDPFRYEVDEAVTGDLFDRGAAGAFEWLSEYVFDPSRTAWPTLLWVSLASLLPPDRSLARAEAVAWLVSLGVDSVQTPYLLQQALGDLILTDFWVVEAGQAGHLSAPVQAALAGHFELPDAKNSLVQPTGDILVPPSVPMAERWRLDRLASRVKSDRVSTYRMDQAAVKRGLADGMTVEQHISALESLSRTPLPDNVRINMEDWYRAAGRHRVMEVTVVHSQNEQDSRDVETVLGSESLGRLSPTDVIIAADRVKAVMKRLEKSGVPILPEVLRPSDNAPEHDWMQRRSAAAAPWTIHLPRSTAAEPEGSTDDIRSLLQESQRNGQTVRLTYQVPGETHPVTERVIPVTIEPHWAQVYVVSQRRYILVEWARIMAAALEH